MKWLGWRKELELEERRRKRRAERALKESRLPRLRGLMALARSSYSSLPTAYTLAFPSFEIRSASCARDWIGTTSGGLADLQQGNVDALVKSDSLNVRRKNKPSQPPVPQHRWWRSAIGSSTAPRRTWLRPIQEDAAAASVSWRLKCR